MTYDYFKVKIKKLILFSPLLFLLLAQGCSSSENTMNLNEDLYNEGHTIATGINDASKKNTNSLEFDIDKHESFFENEYLSNDEKDFVTTIQDLYTNAVYSMSDESYDDELENTKETLKTKYGLNVK